LGGNTGAEEALSVNTSTFASATGGVDGDFYRYTAVPAGFAAITAPDLAIAASGDTAANNESATKITYYTPRFSGFQAGVSYTPNTDATGITGPAATGVEFENIWSGGLNYSGQFDSVGVKAAATIIHGSENQKIAGGGADLEGWDVGANVSFSNITVGGSYGDYGDTLGVNTDATYWDAGVGYAAGAFSASATYLASETDFGATSDEFDNLSVGVDYQLAPGLVPYVEASFFNYDDAVAAAQNEGTVVLMGTELTF
jgi:predicted porin